MKSNKEYTLGRGIAIAGKWLSIAIMVTIVYTSTLNFITDTLNPDKGYYERPPYPEPYREPVYPTQEIPTQPVNQTEKGEEEFPTS